MITVTGVREIDTFLKGLPSKFSHRIVQAANAKAAKPLINAEKMLAPKSEGDLRDSIGVKKASIKRANAIGEIKVGPLYRKGGRVAHLIEYGTKQRQTKGKGKYKVYRAGANRGRVTPKPFVEPAFNRTKDTVTGSIIDELKKATIAFANRTLKKFG
jgi:HK97 gp10 family phage protein